MNIKENNCKTSNRSKRIKVPEGKFASVCPHWNNRHCHKTPRPTYVQNADFDNKCNNNYSSCSIYNANYTDINRGSGTGDTIKTVAGFVVLLGLVACIGNCICGGC